MNWLGWSGLDAVGRLAMLTASTAVLSRCMSPRDFGVAALVLTVVTVASVLVGAPFEEALAQRKVLRLDHLRAALTGCWLASAVLLAASIPLGMFLGWAYGESRISYLLPICMISIFFSGHSDVLTGLIRRHRRFTDLAKATLFGNAVGIAFSIAIALAGGGVWALIAQRALVVAFRAMSLQSRLEFVILPSRSIAHLRDIQRYAGLALLDRMMDNLTFLAFNYLVGGFYGLNALGYVNMAMRLVEPIRGAIGATGHNVAFSFFARLQHDPDRLRERAQDVISKSALAIAPVFIGLAAVTPVLLPLVSGPGWDDSIEIGVCLAIGSAIAIPARLVFTALSAKARPEFSLIGNVAGFLGTLAVLLLATKFGPLSVGLARVAGDLAQALIAIGVSPALLGWSRRGRLLALAQAWLLAAAMGVFVASLHHALPNFGQVVQLALSISLGVALYAVFLGVFARSHFSGLSGLLGARAKTAQG
jgi:O-antigen/teichoic acid export membrane protein